LKAIIPEENLTPLKSEKIFVVIDHLQVFEVGGYRDQIDKESKLITGLRG